MLLIIDIKKACIHVLLNAFRGLKQYYKDFFSLSAISKNFLNESASTAKYYFPSNHLNTKEILKLSKTSFKRFIGFN